jgi:hypothetical protein
MIAGSPLFAEDWIYLGGRPAAEMDVSTFELRNGLPRVSIRVIANRPEGLSYFEQTLDADCRGSRLRIVDGRISFANSARFMPMPDLPEHQRMIEIPAGNSAYNRTFEFLCKRPRG